MDCTDRSCRAAAEGVYDTSRGDCPGPAMQKFLAVAGMASGRRRLLRALSAGV